MTQRANITSEFLAEKTTIRPLFSKMPAKKNKDFARQAFSRLSLLPETKETCAAELNAETVYQSLLDAKTSTDDWFFRLVQGDLQKLSA